MSLMCACLFLIWCFVMPSFHYLLLQSNNKRKPQATGTQENSITFNKKSFINNELLQLVRRNACPNQIKHWHDVGYLSKNHFLCVLSIQKMLHLLYFILTKLSTHFSFIQLWYIFKQIIDILQLISSFDINFLL